jgi:hypothetical protein
MAKTKNKVVECIVKTSVEKATLIPRTLVTHGMDDFNKISHARMVQSQQHLDVTYKIPLPFTKYVCCTFRWALHGNLCKHQVVILLFLCVPISPKRILFNIVGHGMDPIMQVLLPCLWTIHIYTFMIINPIMRNPMKMTLKNYGLSTWVGF